MRRPRVLLFIVTLLVSLSAMTLRSARADSGSPPFLTTPPATARPSPAVAPLVAQPAPFPAGLHIEAAPYLVDVGGAIDLTVHAPHWPASAAVTLSFLAPHHGFTGKMNWDVACKCFKIDVFLAKRIHALEQAKITATVTLTKSKRTFVRRGAFLIRGLAPNGKDFALGGTPYLTAWVSDPQPVQNEYVHFCVWARYLDSLGIPNLKVAFSVHFALRSQSWTAGYTGKNGVLCSSKSIGFAKISVPVHVDVYVGSLHQQVTFVPRSKT